MRWSGAAGLPAIQSVCRHVPAGRFGVEVKLSRPKATQRPLTRITMRPRFWGELPSEALAARSLPLFCLARDSGLSPLLRPRIFQPDDSVVENRCDREADGRSQIYNECARPIDLAYLSRSAVAVARRANGAIIPQNLRARRGMGCVALNLGPASGRDVLVKSRL